VQLDGELVDLAGELGICLELQFLLGEVVTPFALSPFGQSSRKTRDGKGDGGSRGIARRYGNEPVGRPPIGAIDRGVGGGSFPPVTGLSERLLAERDTIRAVLGRKWWQAVLLTASRLGCDFGCLLAALRATGASPHPSLVLLAYSAAGILALLPLTPGGLGMVEAGLSGLLVLAGVRASDALLATLAYRVGFLLATAPRRAAGLPSFPPPLRTAGFPAGRAGRGRPAASGRHRFRVAGPGHVRVVAMVRCSPDRWQ